jgi:hypothetical protein
MDPFSDLVPNGVQVASGIHFQHPDQPLSATTLPQTHPLKTRITTLPQALHFMRDWQASPLVPFSSLWDLDFCPAPKGRTHTSAVNAPPFQAQQ